MGEVYRARDTRLNRDVALKVSTEQFSERFEREAQAIAALNHPNICQLYDVGPNYLVMELIEGAPLKGPLPLDQALKYAAQTCDALDAAHNKGITHRDLKPANILVTKSGIKLLDFGLAKLSSAAPAAKPPDDDTLTMALTGKNEIVGTLYYMSPEQLQAQATGKEIDARSDIFSFGLVLYEMLTGKRAIEGSSPASVIAAIMERPAPSIADVAPPALDRVLKRCLEKDPDHRWQTARDLRAELEWIASAPAVEAVTASAPSQSRLSWAAWAVAGVAIAIAAVLFFTHFRETPPEQQSYEFQIAPPPNTRFSTFRLSPDGRAIAFIATDGALSGSSLGSLWIRMLDSLESRKVPGSDGSNYPFWSPDGAFVAYYHGGKLKKVAVKGGPPQTICDAIASRGGAWGPDGTILFSDGPTSPILKVPSSGGKPVPLTKFAGGPGSGLGHRAPEFLPDGRHFLFLAPSNRAETSGVYAGALDGSTPVRVLPDGFNATYSPDPDRKNGHLFFLREGTLMAIRFDAAALRTAGEPFPVVENVGIAANESYGAFSSSAAGSLAYWSSGSGNSRELVWMDRAGKRMGTVGMPGPYALNLTLSHDEKTLAVTAGTATDSALRLIDLGLKSSARFTFGVNARNPIWMIDGASLFYSRVSGVTYDIVRKAISGGTEELLVGAIVNAVTTGVSPDGKQIAYLLSAAKTGFDIDLMALDGKHQSSVYLATAANERDARFSPDGKWMAYISDESGRFQVYVQTIPTGGAKYQISTAGGGVPVWRHDGKELFYRSPDQKMMSVPVRFNGTAFEPGTRQELFPVPGAAGFTVTRDGQRFLVNVPAGGEGAASAPPLTVVTNWQAALKK